MICEQGGLLHLWFYIRVAYFPFMQDRKIFKQLSRSFLGFRPCLLDRDILTQIAMWKVLHCDADITRILVPTKELHNQIVTLVILPVS